MYQVASSTPSQNRWRRSLPSMIVCELHKDELTDEANSMAFCHVLNF